MLEMLILLFSKDDTPFGLHDSFIGQGVSIASSRDSQANPGGTGDRTEASYHPEGVHAQQLWITSARKVKNLCIKHLNCELETWKMTWLFEKNSLVMFCIYVNVLLFLSVIVRLIKPLVQTAIINHSPSS